MLSLAGLATIFKSLRMLGSTFSSHWIRACLVARCWTASTDATLLLWKRVACKRRSSVGADFWWRNWGGKNLSWHLAKPSIFCFAAVAHTWHRTPPVQLSKWSQAKFTNQSFWNFVTLFYCMCVFTFMYFLCAHPMLFGMKYTFCFFFLFCFVFFRTSLISFCNFFTFYITIILISLYC